MVIKLKRDTYSGADGSSLSDDRCQQIISLYDFWLNHPGVTYRELQVAAVKEKLYTGQAASIIRTFCKLLKKLSFVEYSDGQPFIFTDMGTVFVRTHRALLEAQKTDNPLLTSKLLGLKQTIIMGGIEEMSKDPNYDEHPIWIALGLLKHFNTIDWKEHYYALYLLYEKNMIWKDIITKISENRTKQVEYDVQNANGEALANTGYSYIRSLLLEAGLITNIKSKSSLVPSNKEFIEKINKF